MGKHTMKRARARSAGGSHTRKQKGGSPAGVAGKAQATAKAAAVKAKAAAVKAKAAAGKVSAAVSSKPAGTTMESVKVLGKALDAQLFNEKGGVTGELARKCLLRALVFLALGNPNDAKFNDLGIGDAAICESGGQVGPGGMVSMPNREGEYKPQPCPPPAAPPDGEAVARP